MPSTFSRAGAGISVCVIAAVAGGLGAPEARGSGFQFDTVYHSDSPMIGAPGGAALTTVDQVIVLEDGRVATIARFATTPLTTSAITLNATGDASVNVLAQEGQAMYGAPAGPSFADFWNLSGANGRVTFVGESPSASGAYGLFRYDENEATPGQRIFFEGGSIAGRAATLNTSGGGTVPSYGVNASGDVVFGAKTTDAAQDQLLARWNVGDTAPALLLDQNSPQSEFNSLTFPPSKVMTASGAAVFAADQAGSRRIFGLDSSSPAAQQRVADQVAVGGFDYMPFQVFAASGQAGSGATLFRAIKDPAGNPSDSVLLKLSSGSIVEVGSYDGSATGTMQLAAEMSDGGHVAVYVPDSADGKLLYMVDAPTTVGPTIVAGVGDLLVGGYSIEKLALADGAAPMVNDNGVVVFDAEIVDGDGDHYAALIAWTESDGASIVLKSGDPIDVNGQSYTVASFNDISNPFTPNAPFPVLSNEAGVLKDGLNNANQLAFGVQYFNGSENLQAVLITQVPEPATTALLLIGLGGALLRRRR
jgi:hypothetical protein